jgi:ATP-binding cassette subfamily C exporter for protease/lipase
MTLTDTAMSHAHPAAASSAHSPIAQGVRHGLEELQSAVAGVHGLVWRAFGFGLCASLLGLAPSWYMLEVYDRVLNSRSGFTLLMLTVAVLLAYALIQAQEWARTALMRTAGDAFDRGLHERIFHAALAASRTRGAGGGAQALNDLRTVREFFDSPVLVAAFEAPMVLVFLALLLAISPWLALVALVAALLQCLIGWLNERSTGETLRQANRRSAGAQLYAEQLLSNAQVVQSMGMLGAVHRRWLDSQREALALQQTASQAAGSWQAGGRLLQNTVSSALLGLSCWLLLNNELNGGGGMLVVAGIFGGRALGPFIQIVTRWQGVINTLEAWSRLAQLLKAYPTPPAAMPLPAPAGALAVEHVSANAPGSALPLLRDLHFTLQPGEVLAVVGPSSAGKTTLARVLLGLWPAQAGKVRLAGADVAGWAKAELGPHLGYLPQGVELLDGSLAANIARFGSLDPQKLQAVIEETGLQALVQSLPQGLDTPVGPAGAVLSGGQRQRVGLARALYGRPALVVLDEPNAHLDEAGDAALVRAIEARKRQGTTFVVMTHRTSVLAVCDKVLLLQEGRQQAFGPRDEVLAAIQQAAARTMPSAVQVKPTLHPQGAASGTTAVPAPSH